MTVEIGTTLAELDENWPLSDDPVAEGDDHIRIIKEILKLQFPGAGNVGFSKTITATEDEINHLVGVTSNIDDQFKAQTTWNQDSLELLTAPLGMLIVASGSIVPLGWEVQNYGTDFTLRIIDLTLDPEGDQQGSILNPGGADDPLGFDHEHTHVTASHELQPNEIPIHTHGYGPFTTDTGGANVDHINVSQGTLNTLKQTEPFGGSQGHNHGDTAPYRLKWKPRYLAGVILMRTELA